MSSWVRRPAGARARTVELPLSCGGRPIHIQAVVMSNGSTGASDVLVGNYHMRYDWNYLMSS